ncbi:TolC family outer membrane protein [Methylomonas sp. HYX-M1]|uniref:TolC family outer membrane protein n=1 Tax=Methylomonas sp. HYX-M1 TaxID=3139307 RepID=UPI00345C5B7C
MQSPFKPLSVALVLYVSLVSAAHATALNVLQIYDLALQNDPTLQEAEANRNALLEVKPQSLARLLPSLSVVGSVNANRYDTTNTFSRQQLGLQYFWDSHVSLKLSQPIYHHDYWLQLSQADNQIAEAEAEFVAEQQNLLLRSAKAYFGVLLAQNAHTYAQAEQLSLAKQLQEMQRRLAVGAGALPEVQDAQAGFDQALAEALEAERKLKAARNELTEILGVPVSALTPLRQDWQPVTPEPNNAADWLQWAAQNNLSLIAAGHHAEAARKTVEVQFAGHLPTLDLVGNVGTTDTDRPQGLISNSQTVGLQLNVPIYLGGMVDSKVRQAEFQYQAALKHVDKQRRAAERQTQDAFEAVQTAIGRVQALATARQSGEISVAATEKGLEIGTRSVAELLTAKRNLARIRRDYEQAKYDYLLNSLQLKLAAGLLGRNDLEAVNAWLSER